MTTIEQLSIPPALKTLVRKPPLINGESKLDYYALLEEIVAHIEPADAAEYIWIFNFTNWAWEVARYTNARALLIDNKIWPALREIIARSAKTRRNRSRLAPEELSDGAAKAWHRRGAGNVEGNPPRQE